MPSLSSILKRKKKQDEITDNSDHSGSGATLDGSTKESAKDFFRNLLAKPSPRSESRASNAHSDQEMAPAKGSSSQPPDPNKPLPPHPSPGSHDIEKSPKAPLQLRRIIASISIADLHKIFSGAPQFFVRSTGYHSGPPHPSVAFPWNIELEIRDLSDHGQIEDLAWASVTAGQHIIRRTGRTPEVTVENVENRAHFRPRCFERPNMLSMEGLERGTVGFAAALEMGVADVLHENPNQDENPGSATLKDRRLEFIKTQKHGLRPLEESNVISRLAEIGVTYHEDMLWHDKPTVEMYTDLFTKVLFPPTRVTDSDDPYSLQIQIEALVMVLAEPVWIDFSNVEWRIRLGQILWGLSDELPFEDYASINGEGFEESGTPKYWLLLQVMLSCDLVMRLDALTKKAEKDRKLLTSEVILRFEKDVTRPIKWSLLLARLWLENIKIEIPDVKGAIEKPAGWLATLASAVTAAPKEPDVGPVEFTGLHQTRQISGLLHFARKLGWPGIDTVTAKLTQSSPSMSGSTTSTQISLTPLPGETQKPSYFMGRNRPNIRRGLSKQSLSTKINTSGWLSRSYFTGLVLPGEGLGHFLISTILENDEAAIAQLGDEVNLYGGFVYFGKSFWSTACIVGRVLAAGKGASECMGWLSSTVLPKGVRDGWVNVEIDPPPNVDGERGVEKARIWHKHAVERDSHVLGDGNPATILPGDFTLPTPDIEDPVDLDVTLVSLDLFAATESTARTSTIGESASEADTAQPPEIGTYSAMMRFTVEVIGGETKEIDFALTYDVHFVTAHPCVPSSNWTLLNSPTNPLFEMPAPPRRDDRRPSGPHMLYAGHALHKSYNYTRHNISSLLLPLTSSYPSALASMHTPSNEVFVIECSEMRPPESDAMDDHPIASAYVSRKRRFGSSLEMLARAWCAERGYNALISRRGRNCIACSIREARALGWKIVLRFG